VSTFDKKGFISQHELDAWEDNIRISHPDWFNLVDDLNQEAMRIRRALQPSATDNRQLLAVMIYYRALQSFQGAVLLAARGMPADALTLVRSCAESAIALGGVAHDKMFIEALISSYDKHRKSIINVYLNDTDLSNEMTNEQKEHFKTLVTQLNEGAPQGFTWDALAKKTEVGMADLYNTVYRSTSGDAAHATILALDRHVCINADGKLEGLIFQPDKRNIEQTLSMAVSSLLHAIKKLNHIFIAGSLVEYTNRWSELALSPERQRDSTYVERSIFGNSPS
jgi:hypothetical protein